MFDTYYVCNKINLYYYSTNEKEKRKKLFHKIHWTSCSNIEKKINDFIRLRKEY